MSRLKLLAGFAAIASSLAVVTALASVGPNDQAGAGAPLAKGDRLPIGQGTSCLQAQWPYGCQWQTETLAKARPHVSPITEQGQRSRPREPHSVWKRRLANSAKRFS